MDLAKASCLFEKNTTKNTPEFLRERQSWISLYKRISNTLRSSYFWS